jgi:hypothetical protein
MGLRRFHLWWLFWLIALCASVLWLFMVKPIAAETSGLDGQQAAFATLLDGTARFALCTAIALAPVMLKKSRTGQGRKWFQLSVVEAVVAALFLGIAAALTLCQMIRIGVL